MRCATCPGEAAYTRRYSGVSLCQGCFAGSVEKKAARTISRHSMISRGDVVAVAVSGGKDSLALLRVLHKMAPRHGFGITAVTVDEGIPGYRDEALGIVRDYCAGLGVKHRVYSYADLYDVTLEEALALRGDGASSCSICGTLRRRALDIAAADAGADSVATGHNLDDAVQTFLINMLSGDTGRIGRTDPDAPAAGPRRIKPFCEIYEEEVVFYAFACGLPFQAEPCPHADEGVRTEIRAFLNSLERRHAGAKNGLYRSAARLAGIVREAAGEGPGAGACPSCGGPCAGGTCSVCSTLRGLGRAPDPNADIA